MPIILTTRDDVMRDITAFFALHKGASKPPWVPDIKWQTHLVSQCHALANHIHVRALCQERHWAKSSHYRRVIVAGQRVADSLNLKAACR